MPHFFVLILLEMIILQLRDGLKGTVVWKDCVTSVGHSMLYTVVRYEHALHSFEFII